MAASTWDESLETGHPLIDRQHRELIALVDSLAGAESESRERVLGALDHVMDFMLFHFVSEEDLMTEVSYPPEPTKAMIDQHNDFRAYFRLRLVEFRRDESASVLPLQSFVDEWLKVHEFGLDRRLADWIRSTQPVTSAGRG